MQMESHVLQVNIDDIIPNRFQPRLSFDDQGLKELSSSIKEHGIIQPLVLRKLGSKYEIIAGERRYKAATMAGLTTVPAVISNIDDNSSAEVALVENIQRRDLTPIEEARSYKNLLDKGYLTQEQLAKKMGLSQSAVANKLRLLNLDDSVQQALLDGKISERHARSLLSLEDKNSQKEWLDKIITNRMTVRQLDQELKQLNEGTEKDIPLVNITPDFEEIKNKAEDIHPKHENAVGSMMVPDDVLTDYSELNMSTPVEEEKHTSRFFETLDDGSNNKNDSFMSGFDFVQPTSSGFTEKKEMDIVGEPEKVSTKEENNFNTLDLSAPGIELNPNNRFFTPEPPKTFEDVSTKQPNEVFDPMSLIDGGTESMVSSLDDDIASIKNLIESLKMKGILIQYTESDTPLNYQMNITIQK